MVVDDKMNPDRLADQDAVGMAPGECFAATLRRLVETEFDSRAECCIVRAESPDAEVSKGLNLNECSAVFFTVSTLNAWKRAPDVET